MRHYVLLLFGYLCILVLVLLPNPERMWVGSSAKPSRTPCHVRPDASVSDPARTDRSRTSEGPAPAYHVH